MFFRHLLWGRLGSSKAVDSDKPWCLASFSGLPCFFVLWFTLHESGRAAKIGKAWAHSSCEWTQGEHEVDVSGGGGWYLNMYKLSSKASSLLVMMSSIDQADVQNCDKALKQMIQCIAFAVGSLPLVHLHSLTWWMSPGLSNFHHSSASVYYTGHKQKN